MCSASPHAFADVIAGNHQILAVVAFAAHDDMDVRIVSVPMIDPDPVELRTEIPLGLHHQVPGERFEIGEPLCVLRGYDEAEVVTVAFAPCRKRAMINVLMFAVEHPAGRTVPCYAVPA